MSLPPITVVTPSFNGARFLEKTIVSVTDQKYPRLEYIIMDAGSTDGSRDIITRYAEKFKYIKAVFRKDRGQWDAVNQGFRKAGGDLLGYINTDDLYEQGALLKIAQAYREHPDGLWYAGYGRMIDNAGRITQEIFSRYKNLLLTVNRKTFLYMVNYLMQPSVFITKKAFLKIGDFIGREKYIMEYDFWLRLANIRMPVVIPETLSYFRLTPSGASLNYTQEILEADMNIIAQYSKSPVILALHGFHNRARQFIGAR